MRPEQVEEQRSDRPGSRRTGCVRPRLLAGVVLLGALAAGYVALRQAGALDLLMDGEGLRQAVDRLGAAGPALIIGLMTLAIVMSPIPSAPIALAAGAAYGHVWGTLYVAVGAVAGALIAFGLARMVGGDAVRRWLGTRPSTALFTRVMHSQNGLMAVVFATRLMPFLSFDVISYAAGLTPLRVWRFAVATLLGIVPASFLLAHFGDGLASGDLRRAAATALALGAVTLLPAAWALAPARWRAAVKRRLRLG